MTLQRAAGSFYALDDGAPYNPAALTGERAQYTLTDAGGVRYELSVTDGVTAITYADGVRLTVSDSGIVGPGNAAIMFTHDASGRVARVIDADGRTWQYTYDADGNLQAARDLSTGSGERYAYADPPSHRLTLLSAPSGGQSIAYGDTTKVAPVTSELCAALSYLNRDIAGVLSPGGTDLYTFAARDSEVALPQGGAFLLGVRLTAGAGLVLALPQIDGGTAIVQRTTASETYAVFRINAAGLETLRVTGAGSGAYTLRLFAAGDTNGDGEVNALDFALLDASFGSVAGDGRYDARADIDADGRVDATDTQLVYANVGFAPNQAPSVNAFAGFTHVDLQTAIAVSSFLTDPEGDPLSLRIVSAEHGTARLSGDGSQVLFRPDDEFAGTADFTIVADDGYAQSAPATIAVTVSDAPLLRLDFTQRNPQIRLGTTFHAAIIGDFADEAGIALPSDYVTFALTDGSVARIVRGDQVLAEHEGFSALVVSRGTVQAATALVLGNPNRFSEIQLAAGLSIYPTALTLVTAGGQKQMQVQIAGGDTVTPAEAGVLYFAGNLRVVNVSANGLITGDDAGSSDVTIVYRGVEARVPVRVEAPQSGNVVVGTDGAVVAASDGAVIAISPNAVDAAETVSLTPVGEADLPVPLTTEWGFVGGYRLELSGDALATSAQMAIPVPDSVPVGQQLFLVRAGQVPDEIGHMYPVWFQDEVAIVGADHVARTSSPPYQGIKYAGVYALAFPPQGFAVERGVISVTMPIAVLPTFIGGGIGGMAAVGEFITISWRVDELKILAIPKDGLPVITSVGVHLNPGEVASFSTTIERPSDLVPKAPELDGLSLEVDATGTPLLVLTGRQMTSAPGTSEGAHLVAVFEQQGKTFEGTVVSPPVSAGPGGLEQMVVSIPKTVIAGIADVSLVRIDTVFGVDPCTGQIGPVERAYASNSLTLGGRGNYVLAAQFDRAAVMTQGDPTSDDPAAALQLVAEIPVGQFPRDTAVTSDHTRAYVTLRGDGAVAVVDLVAMHKADALPGNAPSPDDADPVDNIELPQAARPFWITIDNADHYAYVGDENGFGSGQGKIYVIDLDPTSKDFHHVVKTILVDDAPAGLRELTIDEDGRRLYAAAPNRPLLRPPVAPNSHIVVVNIDAADRSRDPKVNPKKYWEQIASIETGQETFGVQRTGDPTRIAFTNEYFDNDGFGYLTVTNNDPLKFSASTTTLELTLGSIFDTFDVNNAQSVLILPEDAFKSAIGPHPAYALIAGNNRYIFDDPSHDPDAFLEGNSPDTPPPGGSNIGLIRDPFNGGSLVAGTLPIPYGMLDNMAFASGYNYVFAAYPGIETDTRLPNGGRQSITTGGVLVFDLVNLIGQVEYSLKDPTAFRLSRFPVDRLYLNALLPLQEDLNRLNTAIDIRADFRILSANLDLGRFTFGVPNVVDANGNTVPSPNRPIGIDGLPQGLSAHSTKVAPGPFILNEADLARGVGLPNRNDFGVQDLYAQLMAPPNCPDPEVNSTVQLDTGAVIETHDLVSYQSMGQTQQLHLTYNSLAADPRPIITFGWEGMQAELSQYAASPDAELTANGDVLMSAQISFNGPGGTLDGPTEYFAIPTTADNFSVSMQTDLSSLPTGYYAYTIKAHFAGKDRMSTGTLRSVNETTSAFGRGWGIEGAQDLYIDADGSADLVDGDGNAQHFTRHVLPAIALSTCSPDAVTEEFTTIAGDTSTFVKASSSTYERRMSDGTTYVYSVPTVDATGKMHPGKLQVVGDRYGNATHYDYDGEGHLVSVTDPVGLITHFAYSGDHVSQIIDPAGRVTSLSISDGALTAITDPDGSARNFQYDDRGHLTFEINKLGGIETDTYGFHGRAIEAHRPDGTIVKVTPLQVQALSDPDLEPATKEQPAPVQTVKLSEFRAFYTAPNGNVRVVTLNERGQVMEESDALGLLHRFVRNGDGYATEVTDEAGHASHMTYDDRGNILTMRDAESAPGAATVMTYDPVYNVVTSYTDELQHTTHYTIDAHGNNVLTQQADGSQWSYAYLPQGMLRTQTDSLGRQTQYAYDLYGRLHTVVNADGTTRSYEYDAAGNATAIIDELGHRTEYVYDAMNRVTQITQADPDGSGPELASITTIAYDAGGNEVERVDPRGGVTTETYDTRGRLTSTTDALGGTTTRIYGTDENLATEVDAVGHSTNYTYDLRNRLETSVNEMGGTRSYTYDGHSAPLTVTDELGHTTTYMRDERNRLVEQRDALGQTTTWVYDAANNLVRTIDALGRPTIYVYDVMNRRVSTTDALGGVTLTTYDTVGNAISVHDALDRMTTTTYDLRNRPVQRTDAADGITSFTYDAVGNLISMTDPLGRVTSYTYDALNHQISITEPDPDGAGPLSAPITHMTYDAMGNVTDRLDALGHLTEYGYDLLSRNTEIVDTLGHSSTTTYDLVGNVLETTDALGRHTVYQYDDLNRVTTITDALNGQTSIQYDAAGNLLRLTDPRAHSTEYEYDAVNRRIQTTDALGHVSSMDYDKVGNVTARHDALGHVTTYTFDDLNRLIAVDAPTVDGTTPHTSFEYDAVGNVTAIVDPLGHTTLYGYDELDRRTSVTDALDGVTTTAYDAVGNVIAMTDALGRVTHFEYDALNRRIEEIAADPDGAGPKEPPITTYAFDAVGNVVSVIDALGHETHYGYDALNRPVQEEDAEGHVATFEYDAVGNMITAVDNLDDTTRYEFDALNRMVRAVLPDPDGGGPQPSPVVRRAYDAAGNLVSITDPRGNVTGYEYDADNRLTTMTDALGGVSSREYDAMGNVTATVDPRGQRTEYEYDALDRRSRMIEADPDGAGPQGTAVTTYAYDAKNRVTSTTDALGRVTLFAYDALDRQVETTDALGHVSMMQYDAVGNVTATTDALDRTTRRNYDALNRLVTITQPDPDGTGPEAAPVVRFDYDGVGNLVSRTDALGRIERYVYDALDRRIRTIDALGQASTLEYDAVGDVVASTDALGHITRHVYDALGRLVTMVRPDPDGSGSLTAPVTHYAYDAAGNLVNSTDALGRVTQYAYDKLNRRIEVIDALGDGSAVEYDAAGNVVRTIDALGHETVNAYDLRGRLISMTQPDPDGAGPEAAPVTRYAYDAVNNLVAVTDALGRVTHLGYDKLNRRTDSIDALGGISSVVYDAVGNVVASTDPLGRTTTHTYDNLDRVIAMTRPDPDGAGPQEAPQSHVAYDSVGNVVATTDALGRETFVAYDALNRPTTVTDALGGTTSMQYDAVGNLVEMTDVLGRVTQDVYDNLNRRITEIAPDPDGPTGPEQPAVTHYAYDAVGNRTAVTDALGHTTAAQYDALNREIVSTDALGAVTRFGYDAIGNLLSVTDAVGNRTIFTYDALSRRIAETDAFGATRSAGYDAVGNLIVQLDALGRRAELSYDDLNRATGEQWFDSAGALVRTIERTYDAAGQLTAVTDPDATYTIQYDALGRMGSIDNAGSPVQPHVVLGYGYDSVGNVLQVGHTVNGAAAYTTDFTYDALNRMTEVTQSGALVAPERVTLGYDVGGELTDVLRFDSLTSTTPVVSSSYVYDGAGRVTRITHAGAVGVIADDEQVWDIIGRLVSVHSTDGTSTYTYDADGQLVGADYSFQPNQTFGYDANGNPTTASVGVANRILSDGTFDYTYDAEGNRIRRVEIATGTSVEYQWDNRNRLVSTTTRDAAGAVVQTEQIRYDDFGWKIERTVDADGAGPQAATTERFVHDRDQIVMVFAGTATPSEIFTYGPRIDMVLSEQHGANLAWSLADHLGSVRDVVSSDGGTVLDHLTYDAFGVITGQTDAGSVPRFLFAGREFDAALDLYDVRARYYDANLQRFISEDPTGFSAGDANLYRYAGNNPITNLDPTGLGFWDWLGRGAVKLAGNIYGAGKAIVWDYTLGVAYDFGHKIGTEIYHNHLQEYINREAYDAEEARRAQEADRIRAQRERDALDPCKSLLYEISNLPSLPSRVYSSVKTSISNWADEYERLSNSDSLADQFNAGVKSGHAVAGAVLTVGPAALGAVNLVRDEIAVSTLLEEAGSAGRAASAEGLAERAGADALRKHVGTAIDELFASGATAEADKARVRTALDDVFAEQASRESAQIAKRGLSGESLAASESGGRRELIGRTEDAPLTGGAEDIGPVGRSEEAPLTGGPNGPVRTNVNVVRVERPAVNLRPEVNPPPLDSPTNVNVVRRAPPEHPSVAYIRQNAKLERNPAEIEASLGHRDQLANLAISDADACLANHSCAPTAAAALEDLVLGPERGLGYESLQDVASRADQIARSKGTPLPGTSVYDVMQALERREGLYGARIPEGLTRRVAIEHDQVRFALKLEATLNAGVPIQVGYGRYVINAAGNLERMGGHAITALKISYDPARGSKIFTYFDPWEGRVRQEPLTAFLSPSRVFDQAVLTYHPPGSIPGGFIRGMQTIAGDSLSPLADTSDALRLAARASDLWRGVLGGSGMLSRIAIADLPAGELGYASITQLDADGRPSEGRIVLDWNADGHGWFVDPTPLDASEFADPTSAAFGRYDLFSVIAHEVGHTLGFLHGYAGFDAHVATAADGSLTFIAPGVSAALTADGNHISDMMYASDLMAESLGLSQRKLPSQLSAAIIAAARDGAAGSGSAEEVSLAASALDAGPTLPVGLVNGGFDVADADSPAFGWQTFGSATVIDGHGVLSENSPIAPRFMQSFMLPAGARELTFTLNVHFDPAGNGPQDAFEVALLDATTKTSLLGGIGLTQTDAVANLEADGSVYQTAGVQISGLSNGRLPSVTRPLTGTVSLAGVAAGQAVSLYFDLLGFGARGSVVTIDDVRILTGAENTAPTANDDAFTLVEDTPKVIDVLANDTDAEHDTLSAGIVTAPAHGMLSTNADGTLTYVPDANFNGTDSFTYKANDGELDSAVATVSLSIGPINDPPVAFNISSSVPEHGPATAVSASYADPDVGDTHTFAIDTTGTKGKVTNNGNGIFAYDPNGAFPSLPAGATASDTFQYTVTDRAGASSTATATITIVGQNDAPIARNDAYTEISHTTLSVCADDGVLSNDIDPNGDALAAILVTPTSHGTLSLNPDGSFTYVSATGYIGTDSFSYKATDGFLTSNVATVQILVSGQPNQTLRGTPKNDNLSSFLTGSTSIIAEAGDDILRGGNCNDWLNGGPGSDQMWGGAGADLFVIYGADVVKSDTDRINDIDFCEGDQIVLARFDLNTFGPQHPGGAKSTLPTGIDVNGLGADYAVIGSVGDLVSLVNNSTGVLAARYGSNDLSITVTDAHGHFEALQLAGLYSDYIAAGGRIGSGAAGVASLTVSQTGPLVMDVGAAVAASPTTSGPVSSGSSRSAIAPLATVATQTGTSITNVNMPATSSTASSDQVSQSPSITAIAPLSAATKLNATFTSGGGVKSVVFKLVYDPELVTVTGAELGAGMPNGAQIAFTAAATERAAEAEAYIAVTSDQPFAAGTINLASVSIDPRQSVETLDGLLKLVVEDVNSKLFSEPEAVRISIDGLKLGSSETSDTARDTLPQVDFFASSNVNEDPSPEIRLKIPDQDASPDQRSGDSPSADDLMADPENVDMPIRIAIADVRTNEMDESLSRRFEHSRRWTLDWRDNDAATDSLRKVRIPIASVAKGSGASGNPAISLR